MTLLVLNPTQHQTDFIKCLLQSHSLSLNTVQKCCRHFKSLCVMGSCMCGRTSRCVGDVQSEPAYLTYCCLVSLQGTALNTAQYNDCLNNELVWEWAVCVPCLYDMAVTSSSDQLGQGALHVSDMTACLLRDYLLLLARGTHKERITLKKSERESVCLCTVTFILVILYKIRWTQKVTGQKRNCTPFVIYWTFYICKD